MLDEDGSQFKYLADSMGEEEAEDNEKEEETKEKEREFKSHGYPSLSRVDRSNGNFHHKDLRFMFVFKEVFSPPPEMR